MSRFGFEQSVFPENEERFYEDINQYVAGTFMYRAYGKIVIYNRAVYTRENKPRLTLAAAYIRRERKHLYEYG